MDSHAPGEPAPNQLAPGDLTVALKWEELLTARARRRLLDHELEERRAALIERRALLVLAIALALISVGCAIAEFREAAAAAGTISGILSGFLGARAGPSP